MAGIQIPLFGGRLKIRRKVHARYAELNHKVPTIDLGVVVISWWSKSAVAIDVRDFSLPSKPRRKSIR
jgi:hypothetical protein